MPSKKSAIYASHVAVVTHFDQSYGQNESRLVSWQHLCRDVGVAEGTSINQCKKNLQGIFINIVDFVQAHRKNQAVRTFASARELSTYMKQGGKEKFFPKEMAKKNPILRWMLIHVR